MTKRERERLRTKLNNAGYALDAVVTYEFQLTTKPAIKCLNALEAAFEKLYVSVGDLLDKEEPNDE